ncbi:hypothetical protein [Acetomicrobium sp.]|nr:hypothetical protein [Acetomicrobium sp.]MDR9768951.1 hypothetical protein [Acetomicrobium sp.]
MSLKLVVESILHWKIRFLMFGEDELESYKATLKLSEILLSTFMYLR